MSPRKALLALAGVLLIVAVLTSIGGGGKAKPQPVTFASAVGQFMCVSCHEPLAQVGSPQAISEKQQLRGLIARHLTLPEIKTAMVAQYGEEVLGRPPAKGFDLSIYIIPPLVFGIGALLLLVALPKWRARARAAAATPLQGAPPLAPDDAKRLNDDLADFI